MAPRHADQSAPTADTDADAEVQHCTGVLDEADAQTADGGFAHDIRALKVAKPRRTKLRWPNIVMMSYIHLAAVYGGWMLVSLQTRWPTVVFAAALYYASAMGVLAGAHRLWSHRSYKANFPLRCLLALCNTIAFQNCALHWARDHRVHHKYSETDADPHNATRGFFFAHIGWLLCSKHPEVGAKGAQIDISDLLADPVLRFQRRHYGWAMPLLCFVLPTVLPVWLWGESWSAAWHVAAMFRWALHSNMTWCVNSAAHMWGSRPYDRTINPSNTRTVAAMSMGEGFHNYHHVFPWDYKSSELHHYMLNGTAAFIDAMAAIGWAYDLKSVSPEMIEKRVKRTGDGSHNLWGWGDKDQDQVADAAGLIKQQT